MPPVKRKRSGARRRSCNPVEHNWASLIRNQTPAEHALEPIVAGLGLPYRFQYLVPGTMKIADFALPHEKILIEVDGSSHDSVKAKAADAERDASMARMGWRTVRLTNAQAHSLGREFPPDAVQSLRARLGLG